MYFWREYSFSGFFRRRAHQTRPQNAGGLIAMAAGIVGNVGGSQPHLNMQPFLTLTWCIALQGIFPSPN